MDCTQYERQEAVRKYENGIKLTSKEERLIEVIRKEVSSLGNRVRAHDNK